MCLFWKQNLKMQRKKQFNCNKFESVLSTGLLLKKGGRSQAFESSCMFLQKQGLLGSSSSVSLFSPFPCDACLLSHLLSLPFSKPTGSEQQQ